MWAALAAVSVGLQKGPKIMRYGDRDDPQHVVLRIHTGHVDDIVARVKNHEYRRYWLDGRVRFIWLFEDELQAIRYVIATAAPKLPGEVNDPTGKGNIDFNEGHKMSKSGYPIKELYKLPNPINSITLKRDFGMDMSGGWQYVKWKLVESFPLTSLLQVL